MLWKILPKYGMPKKLILLMKKSTLTLKKAEALFMSTSGVKQGVFTVYTPLITILIP